MRLAMIAVLCLLSGVLNLAPDIASGVPPCRFMACGNCGHWPVPHTLGLEIVGCPGDTARVRCVWSCGVVSNWVPCHCDPGGGGAGCFPPGSPVTLSDGTTRPIESIRAGDEVLAFDVALGANVAAPVTAVHAPRVADLHLIVNERIRLTPSQPVLSAGVWALMGTLKVGDSLTQADGSRLEIRSLREVHEPVIVHNLVIGATGSYVAWGIVVHNKDLPYTLYPCPECGGS